MKLSIPKSNFTTDRPIAVLMVFTASVVFGFFSFQQLPLALMPELSYPTVTVRTEYPGAAPEEVENDVSRPIEEALGVIGGLNQISSVSRAGVSDVVLEFVWGTDMSEATQSTLEKLDLVFLPDDANRPLILHFDPSLDPIMELSFSGSNQRFEGETGLRRLRRIADLQIKRALEPIKGVAAVRIRGGLEEEIHVLLQKEKLERTGLSIQTIINRLSQENINVAGGTIKEGRAEYMVRTLNEYENLAQIEDTVVLRNEGREVRIKDLGVVKRSHKEREIITNTNGAESVQIDIFKEADTNMVALAARVKTRIGELIDEQERLQLEAEESRKLAEAENDDQRRMIRMAANKRKASQGLAQKIYDEEGALLQIVADRSTFIKSSIDEVRNTAIFGGILAVIVLFLFLQNMKTTTIIAVSIPMSLLITFAPLKLFGVSLNIMSLGGLALGIGMLVDSSIVVLESIFRCQEEGDSIIRAAVRGTLEVRGAVFASTLTSIAVFFPMVFVEGIAGQAFGDLGLAVVISLLASFVVAVFFIPMLASRQKLQLESFNKGPGGLKHFISITSLKHDLSVMPKTAKMLLIPPAYVLVRTLILLHFEVALKTIGLIFSAITFLTIHLIAPILAVVGKVLVWLPVKITHIVLNAANRLYPPTVAWTLRNPGVVILLMGGCFYLTWDIGSRLENELLPEVHQGEFTFEVRLPVGTPLESTRETLAGVEQTLLANMEDIQSVLVTFGYDVSNSQRSDEGEHTAKFKILLASNRDQAAVETRVIERVRDYFKDIPDVDERVVRPVLFSSKTPIEIEIVGDDLDQLKAMAAVVRERLAKLPELADVETTLKSGAPEVQVIYDRDRVIRYGLDIASVAGQVRDMVKGNEATRFNMKDRRVPILVRLNEEGRESLEDIGGLIVNPGGEFPIPLNAIADLSLGEGPSEVRRIDGRRVALINTNIGEGSLGGAVTRIQDVLDSEIQWPVGMDFIITGQNKEWENSKASLFLALALSLFLVYVIMAAQFESLIHPLIIMFTIPLAFFGTVLALAVLGINLSIVVVLGMIMLAGIVVNNAIVLVDYINTLRRRGKDTVDAIVTAGSVRLRPILMTTATTVLGLLPMALGLGDGAEIRTPMAIAVISGLFSSTLLTLLVIPTLYYLMDLAVSKVIKRSPQLETMEPPQEATA